jgi:hypothetical protein
MPRTTMPPPARSEIGRAPFAVKLTDTAEARSGKATQEELEAGLRIDLTDINQANAEQAELYYRVASRVAAAQAERDTAKLDLKDIEASMEMTVRKAAEEDGRKLTDKAITAEVEADRSVIGAKHRLAQAEAVLLKLNALKDAYHQRGYALGNLSELQNKAHSILEYESTKAVAAEQRRHYFDKDNRSIRKD